MRWTTVMASAAVLLGLSGCVVAYQAAYGRAWYSGDSRPEGSYYCYDCHGYRYFDPYYDWCSRYSFRYRWADHPRALGVYRERYVRIRETHPEYGRYRYQPGYRASGKYREPLDYETWRGTGRETGSRRGRGEIDRGREDGPPGREQREGGKKERRGSGRKPGSWRGGV